MFNETTGRAVLATMAEHGQEDRSLAKRTLDQGRQLAVLKEFVAGLLHIADRLVFQRFDEEERNALMAICGPAVIVGMVGAYGLRGREKQLTELVELVNQRGLEYARCRTIYPLRNESIAGNLVVEIAKHIELVAPEAVFLADVALAGAVGGISTLLNPISP